MSYGIIDDGDEIHIRARITQRWELAELVAKLQQRVDGMPVDISTISDQHQFDAQDVNQRELKDE